MNRMEGMYERFTNSSAVEEGSNRAPHMMVPVQQTQIYSDSTEAKSREKYMKKLFGLGIAECVIGGLCIILAIISLSLEPESGVTGIENLFTFTSQGIWDGFFIIATGILGICVKGNTSLRMYNANMALSIVTALFSSAAIVLSDFASAVSFGTLSLFVIHSSISLLLFAAFVIVIVHSSFCCAGVCSMKNNPGPVVFIAQVPESQQISGIPNMQVVYPTQTVINSNEYFSATPSVCQSSGEASSPLQAVQLPI